MIARTEAETIPANWQARERSAETRDPAGCRFQTAMFRQTTPPGLLCRGARQQNQQRCRAPKDADSAVGCDKLKRAWRCPESQEAGIRRFRVFVNVVFQLLHGGDKLPGVMPGSPRHSRAALCASMRNRVSRGSSSCHCGRCEINPIRRSPGLTQHSHGHRVSAEIIGPAPLSRQPAAQRAKASVRRPQVE